MSVTAGSLGAAGGQAPWGSELGAGSGVVLAREGDLCDPRAGGCQRRWDLGGERHEWPRLAQSPYVVPAHLWVRVRVALLRRARLVVPCVCRAVTTAPSCVSWPLDSVLISLATSVHTDSARRGMDSVQRQTGIGPILRGERSRFLGKQLCCLESHLERQ